MYASALMFQTLIRCAVFAPALAIAVAAFVPPAGGATERSTRYLEDARRYLGKGDVQSAIIQLRNAVRSDPNDPALRIELANAYLIVADGPSAEKEFKAGKERGASEADVAVGLARSYLIQGKADEILKEFPAADRGPALESSLAVTRGYALFVLRRQADAEGEFDLAARLRPQDPLPLVGLAQVQINKREYVEGEALIDQALVLAPDLSEALGLKGEFRRLGGDVDGAKNYFDKAVDANPHAIAARLGRARILLDRRQIAEAEEDIRAVLAIAPRNPLAVHMAATILALRDMRREALEMLQPLVAAKDVYPPTHLLLGVLQFQLDQFEQADTNLSRYIYLTGGDVRSRKLLAAIHLRRNAPKRAIETLLPIAESAGDDGQVYGLLANAYLRDRQPAEAAKWLDIAAQISRLDPALRMQLAVTRLEAGQSEAAQRELERMIELTPDVTEARILLAMTQIQRGRIDEAAKTARDLVAQAPNDVVALNLSGSIEALRRDYHEARARFESALKVKPDFMPARVNLARLEATEGNVAKAREGYNAIIRQDPKNLEGLLALSALARGEGQPAEALRLLEKAAAENPKAIAPRAQLVEHHLSRREPAKALAWARQMQEIDPALPQSIYALARAQLAAGDWGSAIINYRRLAANLPDSVFALHQLARALAATNDAEGAYKTLQQAVQLDESYVPAVADLIEAELRAGRTEAAAKLAANWRANRPTLAAGDRFVGDVAMRRGRLPEAVQAYKAAFDKEPSSINAMSLHQARMRLGESDVAIAELEKWLATNSGDADGRATLGNSLISVGRIKDATATFEEALKHAPDNPGALNNLAWLYDRQNDPRAIVVAERAYRLAPDHPAIADTYGYLLVRRGEIERGLKLLHEAHAKAPSSGEIAYHLAIALNAAKRPDEARTVLDKSLQHDSAFDGAADARNLLQELRKQ